MAKLNSLISWTIDQLSEYGLEYPLARDHAHQLLSFVFNTRNILYIDESNINKEKITAYKKYIYEIIQNHKPIEYIIGSVSFFNTIITVKPPVLIPRPETEFWVASKLLQSIKNKNESLNVLDMCTGTGCIGIALGKNLPNSHITLTDIDHNALNLSRYNYKMNNLSNIKVIESNLFESISSDSKYDLITANPPYIAHSEIKNLDKSVKNWEAYHALSDGSTGDTLIKKILFSAPNFLNKNGIVVCEGSPYNIPYVYKEVKNCSLYTSVKVLYDQYEKQRAILARL